MTFPSSYPAAIYCTTTWCFALKGLRTIIYHTQPESDWPDDKKGDPPLVSFRGLNILFWRCRLFAVQPSEQTRCQVLRCNSNLLQRTTGQ